MPKTVQVVHACVIANVEKHQFLQVAGISFVTDDIGLAERYPDELIAQQVIDEDKYHALSLGHLDTVLPITIREEIEYDFPAQESSQWVIFGPDESEREGKALFWSNKEGWVVIESATVFSEIEKSTLHLPIGGYWKRYTDAWKWRSSY